MTIAVLNPAEVARYTRQLVQGGWGREAQERLKLSRVLLVGMGGLGSTVALFLLSSGVGALRLADHARIGLADLSQQVLYREQDLDKPKANVAAARLKELNSFTQLEARVKAVSPQNVCRLASGCQLLLDTSNNPAARLILNQEAAKLHLPLGHAWVRGLAGGVTTCWPGQGPCLDCALQETPSSGSPAFLSPLPGILGTLLALEALRILAGQGPALLGRLLCFDGANLHFHEKLVKPDPSCSTCQIPPRNSLGPK